jgi:hypothetical protein
LFISDRVGAEHLDRHFAMQKDILSEIDFTHPACTESLDNAVMRNLLRNQLPTSRPSNGVELASEASVRADHWLSSFRFNCPGALYYQASESVNCKCLRQLGFVIQITDRLSCQFEFSAAFTTFLPTCYIAHLSHL